MTQQSIHTMVDINEIVTRYLPISRKKARKFVSLYLDAKRIGNRIYVKRDDLEALLANSDRDCFPLDL